MIRVMSLSLLLVTPLALASTRQPVEPIELEVVAPVATSASTVTITTPPSTVVTVTATATRGKAVQVETTTTIPAPRQWIGHIPDHYGDGSGCTIEQASITARLMWGAGATDNSVEWMLGVMSRESHCDSSAHNGNRRTGDDSWGLCQINALAGWFRQGELLGDVDPLLFANDFTYNAEACVRLWAECGRGPWNYGGYYCRTPEELR